MALRIPWDKYETALLIDAYLKVKSKKMSQQEAIKEVSMLLRCRAALSGIEIDEIFRNENGISMQMKIIGGLIDEKPSGLHSATKMFTEMVALYKYRRSEFDEILIQAKGECVMRVNVQDKFFTWLSMRVSSEQLSELYVACKDIETFCISKHILTAPLFETIDFETLQNVKNTIQTNKMFQFRYFRQIGKMKKVIEYYLAYLLENPVHKVIPMDTIKEEVVAGKNNIVDVFSKDIDFKAVEHEDEITKTISTKHIKAIDIGDMASTVEKVTTIEVKEARSESSNSLFTNVVENKDDTYIWNFANKRIDFAFTTPIEVSYFDEKRKCYGWQNAFVNIIKFLQEDYPAIIRGMVGYNFIGIGKVIFTGMAGIDRLSKAEKINNGLYLETDCSPDEIITILHLLMNKCNMDYDNIEIIYEKEQGSLFSGTEQGSLEVSVDKNQNDTIVNETIQYNEDSSNEAVQDYIVQFLDEMKIPYIDNRNNKGCLWVLGDEEIHSIFEKFAQYKVVFHYKANGGRATKGAPAWWTKDIIATPVATTQDPINVYHLNKNVEKCDTESFDSVYERKSTFENWLISVVGLAEHSAQSYSSAINVAGQYSVRLGFSEKQLYFILDVEQVGDISTKLLANTEFAQMNESQHNRYRAALAKYWDYCNALAGSTDKKTTANVIPELQDEIRRNRIDFITWAQQQQMSKAAILAYLSDIKKCSEFAKQYNYTKEEHFFLIEDVNILEHVFMEMRKDRRFVDFNNERQKRPVSAMNKLIAFRRVTVNKVSTPVDLIFPSKPALKTEQKQIVSAVAVDVDPQIKEQYTLILAKKFVDGFRPSKAIDRNRFKMYYHDMFGKELAEEDERLVHTLMNVGTLRDDRIFVKDEMEQKDLLGEINEIILETFEAGASCIYLGCLFEKFQDQLSEKLHVYNVDSLEKVLFSFGNQKYFKRYNYLFGCKKEAAPAIDVIEYMMNFNLPVSYSEIEKGLWYIPLDKIKQILVTTPSIVNVASEAYLYAPNLPVSENELKQIIDLISHALLQRSYISDVELMQLIEEHCPSVLMNTQDYPIWGLRNALAYLLREKFSFRGAIISDKDEEISMTEVFADFCRRSEHITVDELKSFANDLNTVIYWDSVYAEMVRIDQNEFVRRDHIHFNIVQTDNILDSLIQSEYAPIKNINLFLHFPTIDIPWNSFVLESYVANHSKKFKLIHTSYAATDCCGAVVRKESSISDYRALIVDVLSNNTDWKTEKDALQLLVQLGYQQRRSYSDIEKVMQEAKMCMGVQKNK